MAVWQLCDISPHDEVVQFVTSQGTWWLGFANQKTVEVAGLFSLTFPENHEGHRGWKILEALLADGWEPFATDGPLVSRSVYHLRRLAP